MWLWEEAILQGYSAFVYLRDKRAEPVVADMEPTQDLVRSDDSGRAPALRPGLIS